ncbi:Translational activator GCN1 [Hordeum vulgare]|nr:Translational activator GCN1 [Hordeum vulgare]
MRDFPVTPGVEVIDGHDKHFEKPLDKPFDPVHDRKRKRGGLMEEEIYEFCSMTEAVNEVATTIMECKPLDIHPHLYGAVMTQGGFNDEALMAALSHLLDNKAEGVGFVVMAHTHKVLWLRSSLGKHYYCNIPNFGMLI